MSALATWSWIQPERKPTPIPYVHDPRFYRRIAPHIRGRVFPLHKTRWGDQVWGMKVVNTRTGQVLATDNCANYQSIANLADEVTAIHRAAWFWDIRRKAVQ